MHGCGQWLKKSYLTSLTKEIPSPQVLTHYETSAKAKISVDVSAYGLAAVLLQ